MTSGETNPSSWICALKQDELADWQQGLLDLEARTLGITGWAVPMAVNGAGALDPPASTGQQGPLLCAPWLQLQQPLSPAAEQRLVSELRRWWQEHSPLTLWDRPLLILEDHQHLSHPIFSLKRLHLAAKDLLIVSRDDGDVLELMGQGFDGQIQTNWIPEADQPGHYLLNLKRAHHSMEARGCWIPAVQAVPQADQQLWQEASPETYQEWLEQATAWSQIRFLNTETAPVWIDGWEGHKHWWSQPQTREQTPEPTIGSDTEVEIIEWGKRKADHIALMVHGYYLDQLEAMLDRIAPERSEEDLPGLDLYVSTPKEQINDAKTLLSRQGWSNVFLGGVPNRGRDIAPFLLQLLPAALAAGHKTFIKVHTKRSPHLHKGNQWGEHLIDSLISPNVLMNLEQELRDPSIGLLAPMGSILPSSVELRQNSRQISLLLKRLSMNEQWAIQQNFIGGSMMAGKLQALSQLLRLASSPDKFEPENGQTDGTLAHAIERMISWLILKQGLAIKEIGNKPQSTQHYGYNWVSDHTISSTQQV